MNENFKARPIEVESTPLHKKRLYEHRPSAAWFSSYGFLMIKEHVRMVQLQFPCKHCKRKTSGALYASTIRAIYYDFLWNVVPESFQDVDLLCRIHLWFMHDVAQTHFLLAARISLNNLFPKQRIGRGGIRAWPASFPNLSPTDFIFGDI